VIEWFGLALPLLPVFGSGFKKGLEPRIIAHSDGANNINRRDVS
jgi:hypothetical protein